ncbi:MAG: hypothetical protein RXO24_09520 [Acidilobus sp.]
MASAGGNASTSNNATNMMDELKKVPEALREARKRHYIALGLAAAGFVDLALFDFLPSYAFNSAITKAMLIMLALALLLNFLFGSVADAGVLYTIHQALSRLSAVVYSMLEGQENSYGQLLALYDALPEELKRLMNSVFLASLLVFYAVAFAEFVNIIFILATRMQGLSLQLQSIVGASVFIPAFVSLLLGLGEWREDPIIRPECAPELLEALGNDRTFAFLFFIIGLLIFIFSLSFMPVKLSPEANSLATLITSFYLGFAFGFLAFYVFMLMLMKIGKDAISLECLLREQITTK